MHCIGLYLFISEKETIFVAVKLLQINVTANWGSHGRIAEGIATAVRASGWQTALAYGRHVNPSQQQLYRIGSDAGIYAHVGLTRIFDRHGLGSASGTKGLISFIRSYKPDIIHLHNIHGYYLNYPLLFDFLRQWGGPVVWTLHDCWPFTGHCAYFDYAGCDRWLSGCHDCPEKRVYPSSLIADNSRRNYALKRSYFSSIDDQLTLVPVSEWLAGIAHRSFLGECRISTIYNGIDTEAFSPKAPKETSPRIILGVAGNWDRRKGLDEFIRLSQILPEGYRIRLVGLTDSQIRKLPPTIEGISRTQNVDELAKIYSQATVLVNPTLEDNLPTINLEAQACGTPVVTYRTGGSPETIDSDTGIVVDKGDVDGLLSAIKAITASDGTRYRPDQCRSRILNQFTSAHCSTSYLRLYNHLLNA